jgi:hypothetical protein
MFRRKHTTTQPAADLRAVATVGRATPAAQAYTNARRAGRTHPDRVEVRQPQPQRTVTPNRAVRRANGQRYAVDLVTCLRLPLRRAALAARGRRG